MRSLSCSYLEQQFALCRGFIDPGTIFARPGAAASLTDHSPASRSKGRSWSLRSSFLLLDFIGGGLHSRVAFLPDHFPVWQLGLRPCHLELALADFLPDPGRDECGGFGSQDI